jgi:hypothetical protein
MVSRPLSPRVVVSNLPRRLSSWSLAALGLGFTGAMVGRFGSAGDYPMDAERSVNALSHGHFHDAVTHQPLMGPLSIVRRAPFVTLARFAGAGEPGAYKTGAAVCILLAAALGVSLALSRLDSSFAQAAVLVVVTVLNPASIAAVQYGHPEEVLAAALSVGAVALALRDRELAAAVALGLAIASKQWAILAVAPTLLALPSGKRLRLLCISGVIAAGATLPLLAADPAGFGNVSRGAVNGGVLVTRSTWWFFAAAPDRVHLQLPAGFPTGFTLYRLPSWLGQLTHPLIVGLAVPLSILVYWRNRTREAALPLIAILFLLRCALDPMDNAYYHVPLLLALLAFEVLCTRRQLPVVTLLTAAMLWLTFDVVEPSADPRTTSLLYLGWTAVLLAYLVSLLRPGSPRRPELGITAPTG